MYEKICDRADLSQNMSEFFYIRKVLRPIFFVAREQFPFLIYFKVVLLDKLNRYKIDKLLVYLNCVIFVSFLLI